MFAPINETTAVRAISGVANRNAGNPAANSKESKKIEVTDPDSASLVSVDSGPENTNPGNAVVKEENNAVSPDEVRKSEVTDGELKTKVYDHSGKLLRVIPPGYLPAGEQKFDVTI